MAAELPALRRRRPAPAWAWLLAALLALAMSGPATAQTAVETQPVTETQLQVEAAFLVNFVRYTDWPPQRFAGPAEPYVLSVVGSQDVANIVSAIAAAAGTIQGRRILVRYVEFPAGSDAEATQRRAAAGERLRGSHLVFLPAQAGIAPAPVLQAVRGAQVLTVSDVPGFTAAGGMLELVRVGEHLAFHANQAAISAAGVMVSAKVLKLAQVRRGGR